MKKDFSPTHLDYGTLQIYLARHFGFCYGVENAIEIAFKTLENNPDKRVFLLSEMIHNPQVNQDLINRGVQFLMDTKGNELISLHTLTSADIVLIPAFGTTLEMEVALNAKGIEIQHYNTTCPFVEKVWNRSAQIAKKGYSVVVHGKPDHEETKATFSHSAANTPTIVVKDMVEAIELGEFIKGNLPATQFLQKFSTRTSPGFNIEQDLNRIGVVNQTTMLAADTQEIAEYLKRVMKEKYQLSDENIGERFADTRDTLCYATMDNQSAIYGMLDTPADLALVIGGYNSSNTSHLVELCEARLPTYFINDASKIISTEEIHHFNLHTKQKEITRNFLPPARPVRILLTSGASCPDAIVEQVIDKLKLLLTKNMG